MPQAKKGKLGEELVQKYLESRGWTVYFPFTKGAHWFDMLACKSKEKVCAIDVKTKARFNYWEAQGINKKHYEEYINFTLKTKVPFFLMFVDDKNGDVFCANLLKLKNANKGFTPGKAKHIIAWELDNMKKLFNIGDENVNLLSQFDTRKHEYNPVLKAKQLSLNF